MRLHIFSTVWTSDCEGWHWAAVTRFFMGLKTAVADGFLKVISFFKNLMKEMVISSVKNVNVYTQHTYVHFFHATSWGGEDLVLINTYYQTKTWYERWTSPPSPILSKFPQSGIEYEWPDKWLFPWSFPVVVAPNDSHCFRMPQAFLQWIQYNAALMDGVNIGILKNKTKTQHLAFYPLVRYIWADIIMRLKY